MMDRLILIDIGQDWARQAALIVDGRLEDLMILPHADQRPPAPGEIFWARLARRVANTNSAFVDLSERHQGFLRDASGLKPGDFLPVQVTAYAEPGKAAPVTSRWLMKGRAVIHTPGAPGINVSRRIRDQATVAVLKATLETYLADGGLNPAQRAGAEDGGFILRSTAAGVSQQTLCAEAGKLLEFRALWQESWHRDRPRGPFRFYFEDALLDWMGSEPVEIRLGIRLAEFYARGDGDLTGFDRPLKELAQIHDGRDLFEDLGIWDELDRLERPRVDLGQDAWMTVEPTCALVAVDVNTGGDFSHAAGLKANLAAARELPRQLRLRGLGGQITIDFAPLAKRDRPKLEQALKSAFRADPVETSFAGWTPLGHFELNRKRERRPLRELL